MNFSETMEYFSSFPPFSPSAVVNGEEAFNLSAITELLKRLGNPEKQLKYVHIAGTNGKGSTAQYIRMILSEAGYRTGFFSSPALTHFTEQIQIDGIEIQEDDLAEVVTLVREQADAIAGDGLQAPSAYEVTCAAAFLYFLKKHCDIVVLEVGLGGRLDATNVIPVPELAVITSISFDHTEILGNTLGKIAGEKGGIIKNGGRVLLYPQTDEVMEVICGLCRERQAVLSYPSTPHMLDVRTDDNGLPISQKFSYDGQDYETSLLGSYQINNASMAIAAAALLNNGGMRIPDSAVHSGIADARWMGRFEIIEKHPVFIIDGGHNTEGAGMLRKNLNRYFPGQKITFIAGVLADKSYPDMLAEIYSCAKRFITVAPDSGRALPAGDLADFIRQQGYPAQACDSIEEAVSCAKNAVSEDGGGVICAFGSLYYVGMVREYLLKKGF